jgi:3-hydroxybutyryl-CoA dehydrogenase
MLAKSKAGIEKNLQWLLDKEKITAEQREQCMQRLRFTSELKDCIADLVIEAIIEKKEAKTTLFNQLSLINSTGFHFCYQYFFYCCYRYCFGGY